MIILLPFLILKFREEIEKTRTKENMQALKNFILNDILNCIDENVKVGNITLADASRMRNLLRELYRHIYSHYEEFQKEGINDMVDDALVLEMDIIEYNQKKELEANTKKVTEEVTKEVTVKLIKSLSKKIQDAGKIAELTEMPVEEIQAILDHTEEA